jgi:hypothetical protein
MTWQELLRALSEGKTIVDNCGMKYQVIDRQLCCFTTRGHPSDWYTCRWQLKDFIIEASKFSIYSEMNNHNHYSPHDTNLGASEYYDSPEDKLIEKLEQENKKLKEQIETMKACDNCNLRYCTDSFTKPIPDVCERWSPICQK